MDYKDWIIIFATLAGPILAVQAQKAIESINRSKDRKEKVFTQLMASRGAKVSPEHVQALNLIDLIYYGSTIFGIRHRSKAEQAVLDAWKEYQDNLDMPPNLSEAQQHIHFAARDELFINLLYSMAQDVGYQFDRVQLKRGSYTPVAHEELHREQLALRKALLQAFTGEVPLKMAVVQMPSDPELENVGRGLIERLATALEQTTGDDTKAGESPTKAAVQP